MTTNTFGANGLKFGSEGEFSLKNLVTAAVENAKAAIKEAGHGYVALDLGPTGKLLKPLGDLAFTDACDLYKEVVSYGVGAGADLVLIETMSDGYEAKAAVLAAKESCDLPVFATMIFDSKGKLLTGGNVESTVALLVGLGVDALGINLWPWSGPDDGYFKGYFKSSIGSCYCESKCRTAKKRGRKDRL